MPHPMHLSVKAQKQGDFKGESKVPGREHTVLIQALRHALTQPFNRDGQVSGAVSHGPLTITKTITGSSPQFYAALCMNEVLKEVTIDFYRIDPKGIEEFFYQIQLKNAHIVKIEFRSASALDPSKEGEVPMEDISFAYQTITWEHRIAKTETQHTWSTK